MLALFLFELVDELFLVKIFEAEFVEEEVEMLEASLLALTLPEAETKYFLSFSMDMCSFWSLPSKFNITGFVLWLSLDSPVAHFPLSIFPLLLMLLLLKRALSSCDFGIFCSAK